MKSEKCSCSLMLVFLLFSDCAPVFLCSNCSKLKEKSLFFIAFLSTCVHTSVADLDMLLILGVHHCLSFSMLSFSYQCSVLEREPGWRLEEGGCFVSWALSPPHHPPVPLQPLELWASWDKANLDKGHLHNSSTSLLKFL